MIALLAGVAWAACGDGALPDGPIALSFYQADLGAPRRSCPRSELAVAPGGSAIVETESFYGNLSAGLAVDGSWDLGGIELFARIEPVHYESVIGALSASHLGPGDTSVGAQRVVWSGGDTVVAARTNVALPTSFGLYEHAYPFGLGLGASVQWTGGHAVAGGSLLGLGSLAASHGPAQPRAGVAPSAYLGWRPKDWFEAVGDVRASFGYEAAFDHVAAGAALRFATGDRLAIGLEALVPLAGRERALATGQLRASWRLP